MSKSGILGTNEVLFAQLERLEGVSHADPDAMRAEIERSKAVEGLVSKVIENNRLTLDVAKASVGVGEKVSLPKGLIGR